ncbi:MAG: hypothetical protein GXO03_03635 [Aquificae bacterium]|nr:hypothetical protein [Aquificota bacterium]
MKSVFVKLVFFISLFLYVSNGFGSFFKVPAGEIAYWQFDLKRGDYIVINYTANGGVSIYVTDNQYIWYLVKNLSQAKAKFQAPYDGRFYIVVDNSHSLFTDKNVNAHVYHIPYRELKAFAEELGKELFNYLNLLKFYNPKIQVPRLEYKKCGERNAYYIPWENKIILCNEYIWDLVDFKILNSPQNWKQESKAAITHTLFHEIGHALVHLCNLPVLGKEEDAADALATLAGIKFDPLIAYEGAITFLTLLKNNFPIYWDSHSPDVERFYNILCWLYGSNPRNFFFIIKYYPELSNRNCAYEYFQLKRSWETLLRNCGFNFTFD